jgi:phosphoglycolate phosphatase
MRSVIFDLDGTLVDSAAEIVGTLHAAWQEIFPGRAFPESRLAIGPPLDATLAALDPGLDPQMRAALAASFRARYDRSDYARTLPYPGVPEILDALTERGDRCHLATNKRRTPSLAIAARWFPGRFASVACSDGVWPDDGTRPAGKSAMIDWILRGGDRASATFVGDTTEDVSAGRACGVRTIAVSWGYGAAALREAKADVTAGDAAALSAALGLDHAGIKDTRRA